MPSDILDTPDSAYDLVTTTPGPAGKLPLTDDLLRHAPSGDLFGWTQNVGMGWNPALLGGKEFLILSTHGGLRGRRRHADRARLSTPGHWEVGLLVKAAAEEFQRLRLRPVRRGRAPTRATAARRARRACSTACPTATTPRTVLRRLMRSLPTRSGVLGVATCDKGLPAMMMALAGQHDLPDVLVPGGVMLAGEAGDEDTGKVQIDRRPLRPRRDHAGAGRRSRLPRLRHRPAAAASSSAPRPRRRSSARRSACRCRTRRWRRPASRSGSTWPGARPGRSSNCRKRGIDHEAHPHRRRGAQRDGRSRGVRRHDEPAAAHRRPSPSTPACTRPTVDDWTDVNRQVPRLVDALPNGPVGHPTVRVFLAGGVPEVMLHLRELGLLELDAADRHRRTARRGARLVGDSPNAAQRLRDMLHERDGVDPDDVIMSPERGEGARPDEHRHASRAATSPRTGRVIKSTAIDPSVVDADGVYRKIGPAKVFTTEKAAIAAIKGEGTDAVVAGRRAGALLPRPDGQRAWRRRTRSRRRLKHLQWGKHVAVITDARFSGVSTGRVHRPRRARKRWPAARSASSATATASRSSSTATSWKARVDLVGDAAGDARRRVGHAELAKRAPAPGPGAGPAAAGRHAAVGGAAARQRRRLGRLRVRRGRDRGAVAMNRENWPYADNPLAMLRQRRHPEPLPRRKRRARPRLLDRRSGTREGMTLPCRWEA